MTNGFGAVVDDLQRAAMTIGTIAGSTAGMSWREPSGDYGHAGLQSAYAEFIADMKRHVVALAATVEGHGDGLKQAAGAYRDADVAASTELGKAAEGFPGGVGSALGGGTGASVAESAGSGAGSAIAHRLNPGEGY
ncbi:MAG: hypothetical protein ACRDRN_03590 [Sciscionella sp.]